MKLPIGADQNASISVSSANSQKERALRRVPADAKERIWKSSEKSFAHN